MMQYNKIYITVFALMMNFMHVANAEIAKTERSNELTMHAVVQAIYKQYSFDRVNLAYQQQASANTALANTLFAEPANASINHFNDAIGSGDGFQEWDVGVEMPLWLPGEQQQQLKLSENLLAEPAAYKQQFLLAISAKVRNLIWQVAINEVASEQAYQVWKLAQKLERDVNARVQAGDLAGTDGLLAKTHALDTQSNYMLRHTKLEQSIISFQHITGEHFLPTLFEEQLSNKTQVDATHPMLALYDQNITTLQTKQLLAKYEDATHPSVSVGMRRERSDSSEDFNHSLGLGFSIAFDDTIYRQPAIADAARKMADEQIARLQLERELNVSLLSLMQELTLKRQQLVLNEEQIKTTQHYLALQQRAFKLGELDLVTFLNSQTLAAKSLNRKQLLEVEIKQLIATVNQALGVIL